MKRSHGRLAHGLFSMTKAKGETPVGRVAFFPFPNFIHYNTCEFPGGPKMILTFLRAFFILLMAAIAWSYLHSSDQLQADFTWLALAIAISGATLLICIDILSPRQKLAIFSGIFFGLIVGVAFSYALSFVVRLLVDRVHARTRCGRTADCAAAMETHPRCDAALHRPGTRHLLLLPCDQFHFAKPRMIFVSSFPTLNSASRQKVPGRFWWTPAC